MDIGRTGLSIYEFVCNLQSCVALAYTCNCWDDVSGAEVRRLSNSYYNRCGVNGRGLSSRFPVQPPCQAQVCHRNLKILFWNILFIRDMDSKMVEKFIHLEK